MSFSHWMTELRTQQPQLKFASEASSSSVASSYAETDSESDSDCEADNFVFFGDKKACKTVSRKRAIQRTAPISIPQSAHAAHSGSSFEFDMSPVHHNRDSMDALDIDEEDLMLFGNLAYFRTQHGDKSGLSVRQRSSHNTSETTTPSDEDEQIFDMEM